MLHHHAILRELWFWILQHADRNLTQTERLNYLRAYVDLFGLPKTRAERREAQEMFELAHNPIARIRTYIVYWMLKKE